MYRQWLCLLSAALVFLACARTYQVFNIAESGSTITQHITVTATVPKTVTTDVATDVSGLPLGLGGIE